MKPENTICKLESPIGICSIIIEKKIESFYTTFSITKTILDFFITWIKMYVNKSLLGNRLKERIKSMRKKNHVITLLWHANKKTEIIASYNT